MKIFNVIKIGGNHIDFTVRANSIIEAESLLKDHVGEDHVVEYEIEETTGSHKDETGRPYPTGLTVNA